MYEIFKQNKTKPPKQLDESVVKRGKPKDCIFKRRNGRAGPLGPQVPASTIQMGARTEATAAKLWKVSSATTDEGFLNIKRILCLTPVYKDITGTTDSIQNAL